MMVEHHIEYATNHQGPFADVVRMAEQDGVTEYYAWSSQKRDFVLYTADTVTDRPDWSLRGMVGRFRPDSGLRSLHHPATGDARISRSRRSTGPPRNAERGGTAGRSSTSSCGS
jgi:hypothetical protein